jgi:hypothetical protein
MDRTRSRLGNPTALRLDPATPRKLRVYVRYVTVWLRDQFQADLLVRFPETDTDYANTDRYEIDHLLLAFAGYQGVNLPGALLCRSYEMPSLSFLLFELVVAGIEYSVIAGDSRSRVFHCDRDSFAWFEAADERGMQEAAAFIDGWRR